MNYMGRVLGQQFSGDFLKEALRKADKKMPYRGPEYYQAGEYTWMKVLPLFFIILRRNKSSENSMFLEI